MKKLVGVLSILAALVSPALAHSKHRVARHHHRVHSDGGGSIITVQTAAGIPIRVSPTFAPKIRGFIEGLVALGYYPHSIGCFATGGHVSHSLHYSGNACDFDQRGWGKTVGTMYHIRALAEKWGLRDGCEFTDCGHIDAGLSTRHYASHQHNRHYAIHHRYRFRHYARAV